MTDDTAERQLLRDVLTWARANGWEHTYHPIHGHSWECKPDQRLEVDVQYSADRREAAMDVYTAAPAIHRLWPGTIREAVDVLAALGVLPATFSTAYAVGHEDGGNEVSADAVERGVEVQMEMLLDRLDDDDTRRALGDWYDGYLLDPPLLPADPYERRIRLEAIVEGVSEILGAPNAS